MHYWIFRRRFLTSVVGAPKTTGSRGFDWFNMAASHIDVLSTYIVLVLIVMPYTGHSCRNQSHAVLCEISSVGKYPTSQKSKFPWPIFSSPRPNLTLRKFAESYNLEAPFSPERIGVNLGHDR